METKLEFNKLSWNDVKNDLKLPINDNNDGYIFGFEIVQNGEILDYEWFETEEERDLFLQSEIENNGK